MKEYIGQILSLNCLSKNNFELKFLIELKENFKLIKSNYRFENIDQYSLYRVEIEVGDDGELVVIPDHTTTHFLEVFTSTDYTSVVGTKDEDAWLMGKVLDNLLFDAINGLVYRPYSSEEFEFEEEEEEDESSPL
jgi:hypothetical protein